MAVSTLAAAAAGTGGMLALQTPAHATETGTGGLIATWKDLQVVEEAPDGTNLASYTTAYTDPAPAAWSSDGSRLLWAAEDGMCGLYTSSPTLTAVLRLDGTGPECYPDRPTWYDGNTKVVFSSIWDPDTLGFGDYQLFVGAIDGPTNSTALFPDPGYNDRHPKAVGDLIAFTRTPDSGDSPVPQVWIYDKHAGNARLAVDNAQDADISPDGRTLVFTRPGAGDLFAADIDGANIRQITTTGRPHRTPVWSPTGTQVAFSDGVSSSVLDLGTGQERPLPGSGTDPAWQPLNPRAPLPPGVTPSTAPSTTPSADPSTSPGSSPSSTPPSPGQPMVQRIAGTDRFDTGVKISQQVWGNPDGTGAPGARAHAVVLATGASFPDALAGGPLAAAVGGPLLLTSPATLPEETLKEIQRVLPAHSGKTIYILGKYGAVSEHVENELNGLGYTTVRLGGDDRYETSRIIADEFARHITASPDLEMPVVLATGKTYADALPAGPLATLISAPIVLTNGATMDPATRDYIGIRPVWPVGGPAYQAAGFEPEDDGDPCDDLAGADRYSTSADVADCIEEIRGLQNLGPSDVMGVATGLNYPDALTGGALMALMARPLLLTDPNSLSAQTASVLSQARQNLQFVELFGGTGALAQRVEVQVVDAVGGVDLQPLVLGQAMVPGSLRNAVVSAVVQAQAHKVSSASPASATTGARVMRS